MKTLYLAFVCTVMLLTSALSPVPAQAASTFYVDNKLTEACPSANYSIANRDCSGSDGSAYPTLKAGAKALGDGQTMLIRGGTYLEQIELGAFKTMVTLAAYSGETVIWRNDDISNHVYLTEDAANITFRDLHFEGVRYYGLNHFAWEQWEGNVWRSVKPLYEMNEIKSRCDATTYLCKKSVRAYDNETKESPSALLKTGKDGDYYQSPGPDWYLYIYSTSGSPAERTDMWVTGYGVTIGNNSSGPGYIVVDGCTFDGQGHVHLKGGYRWWVKNSTFKNVGTDDNDHDIYTWGVLNEGKEAIYENNYFETDKAMGAAIHVFGGNPRYHIIRNNLIKGSGFWGVLLDGAYSMVANNSMYLENGEKGMELQNSGAHHNVIKNNIIISPHYVAIEFNGNPPYNIVQNNIVNGGEVSDKISVGNCPGCTISNNKVKTDPGWVNPQPQTWSDFRLVAGSAAIGTGLNLGAAYQNGFDPTSTSWFPGTVTRKAKGAWDVGAYVYTDGANPTAIPVTPTVTPVVTPVTPTAAATQSSTQAATQAGN